MIEEGWEGGKLQRMRDSLKLTGRLSCEKGQLKGAVKR